MISRNLKQTICCSSQTHPFQIVYGSTGTYVENRYKTPPTFSDFSALDMSVKVILRLLVEKTTE